MNCEFQLLLEKDMMLIKIIKALFGLKSTFEGANLS